MLKILYTILMSKGTMIGLFSGILKAMQDLRTKSFKWYIAVTDIFAATVVGYTVYEWAGESENLAEWQIILLTVILSLNAFLVVGFLTNPKVVALIFKSIIKINIPEKKENDK